MYYLAGPMTGYENHNHPAFHAAAAILRTRGHKVINPAEYGELVGLLGWRESMKRDIHTLLWCDNVITMPEWQQSRGARIETDLARGLDMPVIKLATILTADELHSIVALMQRLRNSS